MAMKKTIAAVGWFKIEFTAGSYQYGDVNWFESDKSGGREFTADPRGELAEVYADGKKVISVADNDGYDIKLQLLSIIDDIEKEWLGNEVDSASHAVAEYTGTTFPKFGLVVLYTDIGGGYIAEWYYQCQVAKRPSRNGKTSEGKFEGQFLDLEITSSPREHDEPKKRLVMYTSYPAAKPDKVVEPTAVTNSEDVSGENTTGEDNV